MSGGRRIEVNFSHKHCSINLDFLCIAVGSFRLVSVTIMLTFYVFFPLSIPVLDHVEAGRSSSEENIDILQSADDRPILSVADLRVEQVVEGLEFPTSMAFLRLDDFLVLEKQSGTVKRVLDGVVLEQPVLDVSVANENERGMLGLVIEKEIDKSKGNSHTYVFVVYTESDEDGSDDCSSSHTCKQEGLPIGNRLYRYELVNDELTNPKLFLDLPSTPGPAHNGGALIIGHDNNIYLTIGDIRCECTRAANAQEGGRPDGRSGILRMTLDGEPVPNSSIIGDSNPLNLYYGYGIRNSFGIEFDPVTGNLWDTENGAGDNDEINLVEPGFNSGHKLIQGIVEDNEDISSLEDFAGLGRYSDPEFVWTDVVGPTAVKFLESNRLGQQYLNDMFVGDVHLGNLYHFELNEERTGLLLDGPLEDKVADDNEELEGVVFGRNFGGISDLEVGPDGYLYVVSIGLGKVFRIVPEGH
jgi:glucose/arabinose dehydrogenase